MRSVELAIGFVPLIDAAPVIMAHELGYFREESFSVALHRQVGWANLRDRLTFGQLDAGQALLGMPLSSELGKEWFVEPLVCLMGLGAGGNVITIRRDLHDAGINSGADLAQFIKVRNREKLVVGHVFPSSMHHYLLRDWLASAGIDPERDVKLCVIPPPQMADHMKAGYVDLFCVGEPWNTLATEQGHGVALLATTDILPAHPEKILAVTQKFARQNASILPPMVRAVLRGCQWCQGEHHREELATVLARPEYLGLPVELIRSSLAINRDMGSNPQQKSARPADWYLRTFAATFPNKMHTAWMLKEMIRWGHLHRDADVLAIAERCSDTGPYREAARSLHIECPNEEFAPMPLRHGQMLRRSDLDIESTTHPAAANRRRGAPITRVA